MSNYKHQILRFQVSGVRNDRPEHQNLSHCDLSFGFFSSYIQVLQSCKTARQLYRQSDLTLTWTKRSGFRDPNEKVCQVDHPKVVCCQPTFSQAVSIIVCSDRGHAPPSLRAVGSTIRGVVSYGTESSQKQGNLEC